MSQADSLLAAVLKQPKDPAPWLVLADWLEEQGDPANLARAELLRLQPQRARTRRNSARQREVDQAAARIVKAHRGLIGALQPLVKDRFPVLAAPAALALFLLADQTSVVDTQLAAGTTWEGELFQGRHAFPTTLRLSKREGNRFQGRMHEDFSSMFWPGADGTFYFRGVVVGYAHVAFVTYRREGLAAAPGLYLFRLTRRGRLNGTWQLDTSIGGRMWLERMSNEK
jgi:uncharacterized protein (TIGR02996 family)